MDIYYIPPLPLDSGGYKSMCRIKFYLHWKIFFGGGDLFFFNEKGSKGNKGTFTRYVDFLKKFKVIC